MFKISPELKSGLKQQFHKITAKTNDLTFQSVLPAKSKALKEIADLCHEAHALLQTARKAQNGRDSESKALLVQLATMHNSAQSLLEMASSGDAGSEMIPEFKQEMAKYIADFSRLAKELEQANVGKEQRRTQYEATAATPEEANAEEQRIRREAEENRALQQFDRYATQMPHKDAHAMGSKKLVLFDMPVIPLVETPIGAHQLKAAGFDSVPIGMYNVLNKQRIVGVNPLALKAEGIEISDFVDQVLKNLSERKGGRWMCVSETPSVYKNLGLQFFWVMESAKLTRLLKLTRGPVDEWGFPFGATHKRLHHAPFKEKQSERPVGDDGKNKVTVRDGVERWHGRPKDVPR